MILNLPLHPILVHFPIALLLAGLGVDLGSLLLKSEWLGRTALLLLILGSLGAAAAVWSGSVQEGLILRTPAIDRTLDTHEESGEITMWLFLGLSAARAGLTWRRRLTPWARWILFVLWIGGAGLLVRTAYYGGRMVYEHGAGVVAPARAALSQPATDPGPETTPPDPD